uniref:Nicastrin n=1 Tax=Kalanchoe fedtschenkoi TaxID=63787 RepID=A0A7N0TBR3_KALFE
MKSASPPPLCLFFLLLLLLAVSSLSQLTTTNQMRSVPDLERAMYAAVDGYPCVRLLNLSGEIGCANPGRYKVIAPITKFKLGHNLTRPSALLVSLSDFETLFAKVLSDRSFSENVAGVLVEAVGANLSTGFSPDDKFPLSEFAPYRSGVGYEWNPVGSGLMWRSFDFPVFLLSESSSVMLQEVAEEEGDKDRRKDHTENVVELNVVMQTTKAGTRDSGSCLREGSCLPLGGYSVWSSPSPVSTLGQKRLVMAVASMDSASFFRDASIGAESSLSGMISLLAAVDALSHLSGLDKLDRDMVFLVLNGESWSYLGSRRFLLELDLQSDFVRGLNSSLIDMVVELGSIGKSINNKSFFAHKTRDSILVNETVNALNQAKDSLKSKAIDITAASASNPGIPPSSLMAFSKKNPLTSGIVLEDFDAAFSNKFYHSHLDDISNVNTTSIVAAASLVARTMYILASGNNSRSDLALNSINVNVSLVEELMGCLLSCNPGLNCELVTSYIMPSSQCPSSYVGVMLDHPMANPDSQYVLDDARFIWNFLADKTSGLGLSQGSCPCSQADQICIQGETKGKGVCVASTTRYVPAYSTRLKFEAGAWNLMEHDSSDSMGTVDPVWTESNWDAIEIRVYRVQNAEYDRFVLFGGISVTVLTFILILSTEAFFTKTLKRD